MAFYDNFRQEELADLLAAYENYSAQASAHKLFRAGWEPSSLEDFYKKEYSSVWAQKHDFSKYFADAADLMAKSVSAHDLAAAIDNFYFTYDTYEYKDQIDDREEAISDLEVDLEAGVVDYMIEHLKNDMEEYGQTDSLSLAADLIISQLNQYRAYREAMGIRDQQARATAKELEPLSLPNLPSEGRLVLQTEKQDIIELGCYPDQVLPQTDRAEIIDGYYGAYFTVPRDWAEEQAKAIGYTDLEEFLGDYTWDTTDGWYEMAFHEGVLRGVSLGALPYDEQEISYTPSPRLSEQIADAKTMTLDQKLSKAKETAQTNQRISPEHSDSIRTKP